MRKYANVTGEYLGEIADKKCYPFTTQKPLPKTELKENEFFAFLDKNGNVQMWETDSCDWRIKTRFEKCTAYSKETGSEKEFDDKSLVTDDYTLLEPLPNSIWIDDKWVVQLDLAQQSKHNEINAWRDAQENNPTAIVELLDTAWDANPAAQNRISKTLVSTDAMPPFWTDAYNNDVIITKDELQSIYNQIIEIGGLIHVRQRQMKEDIEMLTDAEEVQNYVVGWGAE
ncbi:MAG: DUF4376 domain-containing protein [Vibrio sp.]